MDVKGWCVCVVKVCAHKIKAGLISVLCCCAGTDACPALGCPTPGPSASSCVTSVPGAVCACVHVVFCSVLVCMKCGFMLIFLACCGQQIPTLLMALHHVLVCVCVCCDVCKQLCGCQGVVCVRVRARMNCIFDLICFLLCSR